MKSSAGLLLFRQRDKGTEVLLVHMGGPFWAGKDRGAWSIPKGEFAPDEQPHAAAVREFAEELGSPPPDGRTVELGTVRQSPAKSVTAFAVQADFDTGTVVSNTFEVEWPPRSGRTASFPEIDRAEWMSLDVARDRLVRGQVQFLDRLAAALVADPG